MKKFLITVIIITSCILVACAKTKPPSGPANITGSESSSSPIKSDSESTSEETVRQGDSYGETFQQGNSSEETIRQGASSEDFSRETPESKDPAESKGQTESEDRAEAETRTESEEFYIAKISDELFNKMQGVTYKEDCTTPIEDLRYIHVLHVDFENNTKEGEIVCNKIIAEDLLEIFKELYTSGYPIEKIRLMDEYSAEDEASMRDNNTSCFNFRFISHTTKVSKHGLGLAVDINPLYNPYIKVVDNKTIIEPATAGEYADRTKNFPHKIDENDLAYRLFTQHGFVWGGSWESVKDYQHFEK